MTKQRFLQFVKMHLRMRGFRLRIKKVGELFDNHRGHRIIHRGCFDEDNKEILIAGKDPGWLSILVHEFVHFFQFLIKTNAYLEETRSNSYNAVYEWTSGQNINDAVRHFLRVIIYELEAELMTVELIKNFNLNVNLSYYIQQANEYLFSYGIMFHRRKFGYDFDGKIKFRSFFKPRHYLDPDMKHFQ